MSSSRKAPAGGPYHLTLGLEENRLVLDIALEDGTRA